MYKPNFCVECGERVLRAHWYPWTSRRFCKFCTPRSLKARFAWPIFLGTALLALGLMTGRSMRQPPPPLVVQNGKGLTVPSDWAPKPKATVNPHPSSKTTPDTTPPIEVGSVKTEPRSVKRNDMVTLCGAKTKKGTMCTRRVHGGGRCWQHQGLKAMVPEQELIVQNTAKSRK
jgi:hypothetical protein